MKIMKSITQSRISSAIDKINGALERNNDLTKSRQIIKSFALFGMKTYAGFANALDAEKLELEIAYSQSSIKSPEDIDSYFDSFMKWIKYYDKKREKVWNIQTAYQISGLDWINAGFIDSPFQDFTYPWIGDNLRLIPQDFDVLKVWKPKITEFWMGFCSLKELDCYMYDNQNEVWQKTGICEITNMLEKILPLYDWAEIWSDDHCFNLLLGSGKDVDDPDFSLHLCAYK